MDAQIFGPLETFRQALSNCLLDHSGACETDYRPGLGDVHVAEHSIRGRYAARGRICKHHNIRELGSAEASDSDRGARHLH